MRYRLSEFLLCLTFIGSMLIGPGSPAWGQAHTDTSGAINPDAIIYITYEHNPRLAAARHKLRSAEYNYDLFESEYSQFIPLVLDSRMRRSYEESEKSTSGKLAAGLRKEFFDGSSVSVDVGNETGWNSGGRTHDQFIESQLEFPLFSSNRKLSRIIKRTFEENELHSARLDYVEQVREALRDAQEEYYDLIAHTQKLDAFRENRKRLEALLDERRVQEHPADRQQIEDEINSLNSDIRGGEVQVASLEIRLQRELGLKSLEGFRIEPVPLGLGQTEYYGKHYVDEDYEILLERAVDNDVEIKVLHRVRESALEKKRLAEQGRWDSFVTVDGQYSYAGFNGDDDPENDYSMGVGLRVKKFDTKVLEYSRLKAEEDILNVEARIRDRELETATRIYQEKGEAENRRKQLESLYESLLSRKSMYTTKRESYLKGEESIDNLLQAFRSLLDTESRCYEVGNDYFSNVRDLDYRCAVYFQKLGIEVE